MADPGLDVLECGHELAAGTMNHTHQTHVGVDSMMKISIAFLAAMSLAGSGCHKDQHKGGESIARMTELKNKMCACKDKTCSDKVSGELVAWKQAQDKPGDKPAPLSEEDDKKLEAVTEELTQCLLKLELPGGSGTAGPAGAAEAPGGSGATMGSGSPAAGSAAGTAPSGGSAAAGSAH